MVVPEKASSFNIHPERCCSDMCHYCGTKFGLLDTPLHVSQLKTPAIQKFAREFATVTSDACLCDKCFRFIDRKARSSLKNNPLATGSAVAAALEARGGAASGASASLEAASGAPPQEEKIRICLVRNCNREVRLFIRYTMHCITLTLVHIAGYFNGEQKMVDPPEKAVNPQSASELGPGFQRFHEGDFSHLP